MVPDAHLIHTPDWASEVLCDLLEADVDRCEVSQSGLTQLSLLHMAMEQDEAQEGEIGSCLGGKLHTGRPQQTPDLE